MSHNIPRSKSDREQKPPPGSSAKVPEQTAVQRRSETRGKSVGTTADFRWYWLQKATDFRVLARD